MPLRLSAAQLLGLFVGLVGVQYFGVRIGLWLALAMGADPSSGAPFLLATLGLPSALGVAWVWFIAVWREPGGWAALGMTPLTLRWFRLTLLAGVGCFMLGVVVAVLATPFFGAPKGPPAPIRPGEVAPTFAFLASFVLTGVLLAPLLEELVFRGVLFAWLRPRLGFWPAATIAAVLHAVVHSDAGAVAPLTAIFVALAWLYERSGTLWAPVIAHGGHNLISMSLSVATASLLT